jgi:single-stranded-DNA-specific exonuclease
LKTKFSLKILEPDPETVRHLAGSLSIPPTIARILANRGIKTVEEATQFLKADLDCLHDPFLMHDMPRAVDIILGHIQAGDRILIHGDYDADGVTSTAILKEALGRIGGVVDCYIPDRFDEGYGFSPDAILKARETGVRLIITVDCGSSNHDEVAAARDAGMSIVITDHHEVPQVPPDADAFVNIKKPGETYPFKDLSGAGVAFKLAQALYTRLGREDWKDFLDIAAIGTVADVVPLVGENRVIVKNGLNLLNERKRLGVARLLETSSTRHDNLTPWDISFVIAPRINAAGRLAKAQAALEFLLEEDPDKSRQMAQDLSSLNEERQKVENGIKENIESMLNADPDLLSKPVWVLASRGWHQGVIGIVASRFSQSFKRPVFLVSVSGEGVGRGSARCGDNYNIYKALDRAKDLLVHYGGHPLAGGFTIKEEMLEQFSRVVSSPDLFCQGDNTLLIDMVLGRDEINMELARRLETLAPYGEGNPRPAFLTRRVKLQSISTVGQQGRHLKLWLSLGGSDLKGIAFGKGEMSGDLHGSDVYYDIIYNIDLDVWNNQEEITAKIMEILPPDSESLRILSGLEEEGVSLPPPEDEGRWRIVDSRAVINRWKYIKRLCRGGRKCLVLARNRRQMEVLTENLKKEGLDCVSLIGSPPAAESECRVFLLPFDRMEDAGDFEEIVFYHPPCSLDCFRSAPFMSPALRRVHFLFGDEDVMREEANQEVLSPGRERLQRIFQCVRKMGNGQGAVSLQPAALAGLMKDDKIQAATVRLAMKIFSEIGLVEVKEEDDGMEVRLLDCQKTDLEESPFYLAQLRKKEAFGELKRLLLCPGLDGLRNSLGGILEAPGLALKG